MLVFLDALVGPSHHFGGIAFGNKASLAHQHQASNPRKAALESLEKMRLVYECGAKQLIIPPQVRPQLSTFKQLSGTRGFTKTNLDQLFQFAPQFLSALFSTSYMWQANAGIVSAACDAFDGLVHITPANLQSHFHRSEEVVQTAKQFKTLFEPIKKVKIHAPVSMSFPDEGAANCIRFSSKKAESGLNFWVYSKSQFEHPATLFPARQSKEALQLIARKHKLKHVLFAKQSEEAINAGVFHNDVIAMGIGTLLVVHKHAYDNQKKVLDDLQEQAMHVLGEPLTIIEVSSRAMCLEEAVKSYVFNSQLIKKANGDIILLAPLTAKKYPSAKRLLAKLLKQSHIKQVHYVPLEESMNNGGGPACLRLAMNLEKDIIQKIPKSYIFSIKRYHLLVEFVKTHYPDWIVLRHFKDPDFIQELHDIVKKLNNLFK